MCLPLSLRRIAVVPTLPQGEFSLASSDFSTGASISNWRRKGRNGKFRVMEDWVTIIESFFGVTTVLAGVLRIVKTWMISAFGVKAGSLSVLSSPLGTYFPCDLISRFLYNYRHQY
jgi:hypothetical protein